MSTDAPAIPIDDAQRRRMRAWAERMERHGRCAAGAWLVELYRFRRLRGLVARAIDRWEGGAFFSRTLREILLHYHSVQVGRYSYGECLMPCRLPAGTRIGNYCSLAAGILVMRRNHPVDRLSLHPFFYNHELGLLPHDSIISDADNPLAIGHDVWIGANVLILPGCRSIGDGAIVGAGSVVTRDVPPFTIVGGNPARPIRARFDPEMVEKIRALRWWDRSLVELIDAIDHFLEPASRLFEAGRVPAVLRAAATEPARSS